MGFVKRVSLFLLLLTWSASWAQENRYMVFFKDKTGTPYSISQPEEYLSARALARRNRQHISITEQDIPVNTSYVLGVQNANAKVFYSTRWMNGVLVQCEETAIPQIEALEYVASVQLVAPGERPLPNGRKKSGSRIKEVKAGEINASQQAMLGIGQMHDAGHRGEGVWVAVTDSGFPGVDVHEAFSHLFSEGRLYSNLSHDFVHGGTGVFQYDDHGTRVLSVMAAYQPGQFIGGAYKASFLLFVTEDSPTEYRIEEYNWLFAVERADSLGVDIINTSLGYNTFDLPSMNYAKSDMNGNTAIISRAANWAAEKGMLIVTSAGNEGVNSWKTITAPADAENVLSVGGVISGGEKMASSSEGPSADGRIKPEVAALGSGVYVMADDGSILARTGTSYSAPLVTSLAAGIWQRYPDLTNFELIDIIKNTASQAESPDNRLGYGIPNFKAIVNKLEWKPQENLFEVYPNPVISDTVYISLADPETTNTALVEIVSMQGQLIVSKVVSFSWLNTVYTADCSALSSGVYFLQVSTADGLFTYKLVKL